MNNKTEGVLATAAALFVMFSAILDPMISVVLAVAALVGLGIYHLTQPPGRFQ